MSEGAPGRPVRAAGVGRRPTGHASEVETTSSVRTFDMPRADRVLEGPGSLAALPDELARRGVSRVVMISGSSVAALDEVDALRRALDDRLVATSTGIAAHNPSSSVEAVVATARDAGADAVVAVGGGSPIDAAKLVAYALAEGVTDLEHHVGTPELTGTPVPVVAVPTTLSAAEWNGLAGLTVEREQTKHGLFHPRLAPTVVVLDPDLARHTPRDLWTTTGVRAIDHAVETTYAADGHPFGTGLARQALTMLAAHLPRTNDHADDRWATLRCQQAAELSVLAIPNVTFGLSHAIGHQLGAAGVPHGVTSCVMMPHVVRFFADAAPEAMDVIADALAAGGRPRRDAADMLDALLDDLRVPRTLGDCGLREDQLDDIAAATLVEQHALDVAPRPVGQRDVRDLLQAAL